MVYKYEIEVMHNVPAKPPTTIPFLKNRENNWGPDTLDGLSKNI